jgi:selenocysteine lyase/cysteine desulfurase
MSELFTSPMKTNKPRVPSNTEICNLQANSYGIPVIQTPWRKVPLIYADATASGIPYRVIDDFLRCRVEPFYANTHSNGYSGKKMTHLLSRSKEVIRRCTGSTKQDAVIFTGAGSSAAITHAIHAMDLGRCEKLQGEKPIILITDTEHHSNNLPWRLLAADLEIVPTNLNGQIDTEKLQALLEKYRSRKIKIASFSACSNVTGIQQEVGILAKMLKSEQWVVCFDYACSAPYVPITMRPKDESYNIDCIFISPHKFLGGAGSPGLLIINKAMIRNCKPFLPGGGTVQYAGREGQIWVTDKEQRESGGTPNILGEIRCGLAFLLKEKMQPMITTSEHQLVTEVKTELLSMPGITLLMESDAPQLPIFPIVFHHLHYNLAVCLLSQLFGIQVRGGISCNSLTAEKLLHISKRKEQDLVGAIVNREDISNFDYGWVRVTFHFTMSPTVVAYILKAISFVARHGHSFKLMYEYKKEQNNWVHKFAEDEPYGELDFLAVPPTCLQQINFTTSVAEELLRQADVILQKIQQK